MLIVAISDVSALFPFNDHQPNQTFAPYTVHTANSTGTSSIVRNTLGQQSDQSREIYPLSLYLSFLFFLSSSSIYMPVERCVCVRVYLEHVRSIWICDTCQLNWEQLPTFALTYAVFRAKGARCYPSRDEHKSLASAIKLRTHRDRSHLWFTLNCKNKQIESYYAPHLPLSTCSTSLFQPPCACITVSFTE